MASAKKRPWPWVMGLAAAALVVFAAVKVKAKDSVSEASGPAAEIELGSEAHVAEDGGVMGLIGWASGATIGLLAIWALGNAFWSAPEASWLGEVRQRLGAGPGENLFLAGDLGVGERSDLAYLRALNERQAVLFTETSTPTGRPVTFRSQLATNGEPPVLLHGRVRHCRRVDHDDHWYRLTIALEPSNTDEGAALHRLCQMLSHHNEATSAG